MSIELALQAFMDLRRFAESNLQNQQLASPFIICIDNYLEYVFTFSKYYDVLDVKNYDRN
jgi:hypothetical protein